LIQYSDKKPYMKLANFLKNRKITIIAYSPAILLIILFILTKFEIISDGFLPDLIQISAIIIALLVPSVSKEREATKEKKKLNKIYQESFNNLGELCMLCIERKQQITEYDVAIFQLSRKIKKYSDELLNLSITYNEGASNSIVSKSESIVIENIIIIWLNVDNSHGRVWGAALEITEDHKYDKEKKKAKTYETLEKIRKENDFEWKTEILEYFSMNIAKNLMEKYNLNY